VTADVINIEDRGRWFAGNAACDACGGRWPVVIEAGAVDLVGLRCHHCGEQRGQAEAVTAFPRTFSKACSVAREMGEAL
jgi:hypothetical protein